MRVLAIGGILLLVATAWGLIIGAMLEAFFRLRVRSALGLFAVAVILIAAAVLGSLSLMGASVL